jgi:tetratricopeptide (TPR) repeat protein
VLRELAARAVLNEEIAGQVAQTLLEIGLPTEAKQLFAEAVGADRSARNFAVHLQYARLLREEKDLAGARQALISAFRNPANRQVAEIVAYLAAADRLEEFERELTAFELAPELRSEVRRAVFKEHENSGRAEAAFAILGEHPELLDGDLPARMRTLAVKSGAFASATALLERALAESPLENGAITKSLASLYGDWAAVELNALQVESAMTHLRRGHELRPDDFAVARLLSQLCSERGDRKTAAATLNAFIAATTDDVEREKARQLLRRFRS